MPWSPFSPIGGRRLPATRTDALGNRNVVDRPDPNDAMSLYLAQLPGGAGTGPPTHTASGGSANEFNYLMSEQGRAASEEARQAADEAGGLTKVTQGIRTVPTSRSWDAFFGALRNAGADQLKTGAATGMDMGGFDEDPNRSGYFSRGRQPGFFDTERPGAMQQHLEGLLRARDINMFGRVR